MANNQFSFKTVIDRFLFYVHPEPNTGCWLWAGGTRGGYGRFKIGTKADPHSLSAHRFSYEHFIGPIPEPLELDHLCRVTCCVNPKHLEPVTHEVNSARGDSGKLQASRSECPSGHSYDQENTMLITDKNGYIHRFCRECCRARRRAYYAKRGK